FSCATVIAGVCRRAGALPGFASLPGIRDPHCECLVNVFGYSVCRGPAECGYLVVQRELPAGRLAPEDQGRARLIPASAIAEYVTLLESEARAA
ncbi:MAG TPA: hypothetical protein VF223_07820, partial [Trebonia sp.]